MRNLSQFDVLSFDCYGTIIDWERGILTALAPIFSAHNTSMAQRDALELYADLESQAEAGEYISYRTILERVIEGFAARLGFAVSPAERASFADSVGAWPPFADSAGALRALQKTHKLAIISNVDDDLFARTAEQLGVSFDWIVTAQQVRSYKPSPNNFLRAFERIAVPRERQLHVAQSLYHDIAPAKRLGLKTVWVDRRRGQSGGGATPEARAEPDLIVPDLATLAAIAANA